MIEDIDKVLANVETIVAQADNQGTLLDSFGITPKQFSLIIQYKELYGSLCLERYYQTEGHSLASAFIESDVEVTLMLFLIARELDIANK